MNFSIKVINIKKNKEYNCEIQPNQEVKMIQNKMCNDLPTNAKIEFVFQNKLLEQNAIISNCLQNQDSILLSINIPLNIIIMNINFGNEEITINGYDYVCEIADYINQKLELPIYIIELYKENQLLQNYEQIYLQKIENGCTLQYQLKTTFLIIYKKQIHYFYISIFEKIGNIINLIQQKLKLQGSIELFYKQEQINQKEAQYINYRIPNNVILNIKIQQKLKIHIINILKQIHQIYIIDSESTLSELTELIDNYQNNNIKFQLKFQGSILNLNQTIKEAKIIDDSEIILDNLIPIVFISKQQQQIYRNMECYISQSLENIISQNNLLQIKQFNYYINNNQKYQQIIKFDISLIDLYNQYDMLIQFPFKIYYEESKINSIQLNINLKCQNIQEQNITTLIDQNSNQQIQSFIQQQQTLGIITKLFYFGQEIKLDSTFSDIQIQDNETIEYQISFIAKIRYQDETIQKFVNYQQTTVQQLKQTLQEEKQTTSEYQLWFKDDQMNDNKLIEYYTDTDIIEYRKPFRKTCVFRDKLFTINHSSSDTIQHLKKIIANKWKVDQERIKIVLEATEQSDNQLLKYYDDEKQILQIEKSNIKLH